MCCFQSHKYTFGLVVEDKSVWIQLPFPRFSLISASMNICMILKLLWLLWGDFCLPVALHEKQHEAQHFTSTLSAGREKQTPKTRPRCVTFQRSEVRAPLFPIQPMLWVLFQKVLSLANGPWSHKHRDRVQRREGSEVQTARNRRRQRRKKKKKKGELGSEWWNTDTTTEKGSRGSYVGGNRSLAPQLHDRLTRWETEQLQLRHENTAGHVLEHTAPRVM